MLKLTLYVPRHSGFGGSSLVVTCATCALRLSKRRIAEKVRTSHCMPDAKLLIPKPHPQICLELPNTRPPSLPEAVSLQSIGPESLKNIPPERFEANPAVSQSCHNKLTHASNFQVPELANRQLSF